MRVKDYAELSTADMAMGALGCAAVGVSAVYGTMALGFTEQYAIFSGTLTGVVANTIFNAWVTQ